MRILLLCVAFAVSSYGHGADNWTTLPPTPSPTKPQKSGHVAVPGAKIWYGVYGRGHPVVFLHGGLANSDYWALQVRKVAKHHRVIVIDTRGHGRSTGIESKFGYELFADDVVAVLDHLKIKRAAIVGWSDGGIVGLVLAVKYSSRVDSLFAFGANSNPGAVNDVSGSATFQEYLSRVKEEYKRISPTPNQYQVLFDGIVKMWETQPNFTQADFASIKRLVWIVDGDRDEAIKRDDTIAMANYIPGAGLLILPRVSHFAFLQEADLFSSTLVNFLKQPQARIAGSR